MNSHRVWTTGQSKWTEFISIEQAANAIERTAIRIEWAVNPIEWTAIGFEQQSNRIEHHPYRLNKQPMQLKKWLFELNEHSVELKNSLMEMNAHRYQMNKIDIGLINNGNKMKDTRYKTPYRFTDKTNNRNEYPHTSPRVGTISLSI